MRTAKKYAPIKIHFVGIGVFELSDAEEIAKIKEAIRKNPARVA